MQLIERPVICTLADSAVSGSAVQTDSRKLGAGTPTTMQHVVTKSVIVESSLALTYVILTAHLFCPLAVLYARVGNTIDVLSPFITVLCHSD